MEAPCIKTFFSKLNGINKKLFDSEAGGFVALRGDRLRINEMKLRTGSALQNNFLCKSKFFCAKKTCLNLKFGAAGPQVTILCRISVGKKQSFTFNWNPIRLTLLEGPACWQQQLFRFFSINSIFFCFNSSESHLLMGS